MRWMSVQEKYLLFREMSMYTFHGPFTILLTSMTNLVDHIRYIHSQYRNVGHTLKVLVMDAQFTTDAVTNFLEDNLIEIQQPSPYDHGQNGNGESTVKVIQDGISKLLCRVSKEIPHYKKLWGLAAMEVARLRGLHTSPKNEDLSCDEMWGAPPINLEKMPHIPFGSRVLGHIPLEKQTKLGDRSFTRVYAVGPPSSQSITTYSSTNVQERYYAR